MSAGPKTLQEVNVRLNNSYLEVRLFNATDGVLVSRGHLETNEQGTVHYVVDTDAQTEALLAQEKQELAEHG